MTDVATVERKFAMREKIQDFQELLSQVPGAQFGDMDCCPLKHSFAPGVYVREIFIPKGMIIVGKIHKHAHPNFLMSGEVSVVTEDKGIQRLKAPLSMISPAGTKRIVYAHEDTVWITVHLTNETDVKKIEDEVIAKTYEELPEEKVEQLSDIDGVKLLVDEIQIQNEGGTL